MIYSMTLNLTIPTSGNPYYDKAPKYMYCGKNQCMPTNSPVLIDSCSAEYLKTAPFGYGKTTYVPSASPGYCDITGTTWPGGSEKVARYEKNRQSLYAWDPVLANYIEYKKYMDDPDSWNAKNVVTFPKIAKMDDIYLIPKPTNNIDEVNKCCTGNVIIGSGEEQKCGSLLWKDVKDPRPENCDKVLFRYCNEPGKENRLINEPMCTNLVKEQGYPRWDLPKICKDKVGKSDWDKICACHYPSSFYADIQAKITEEWNVPPEYATVIPECMYPQCSAIGIKNPNAKCPEVNFTSCVVNSSIDIANSDIGDIVLSQEIPGCRKFTKITDVETALGDIGSSAPTTTPIIPIFGATPTGGRSEYELPIPPDDEGMSTDMIILIIFIALVVLALIGGIIYYATSGSSQPPVRPPPPPMRPPAPSEPPVRPPPPPARSVYVPPEPPARSMPPPAPPL